MTNRIKTIFGILLPLLSCSFASCSLDEEVFQANVINVEEVDSVVVVPNHTVLVANGTSQIELAPRFYNAKGQRMPDARIKDEMLEYLSDDGVTLSRQFSTADARLIGKTITGRLRVKGQQVTSAPFSFTVIAPESEKYAQKIRIPVIFHIVQTTEDIESFGGPYTKENVALQLKRLNGILSGMTPTPAGVNTNIELVPALYSPEGTRLHEDGINRVVVEDVDTTNVFRKFLSAHKLLWPAKHYMNIWLISDRYGKIADFNSVSGNCVPRFINKGATDAPQGLELTELEDQTESVEDLGVIYKLQELLNPKRAYEDEALSNDLAYYVGRYFGLLPTFTWNWESAGDDYCMDTIDYYGDSEAYKGNSTWYKEAYGLFFRADNIMDDPTGTHASVSRDQAIRMHWVLNNCAFRAAWKSTFALDGK